jgi:hypothetical protein
LRTCSFFDLTTAAAKPTVRITRGAKHVHILFRDDQGDELQVVVDPETFEQIAGWGLKPN